MKEIKIIFHELQRALALCHNMAFLDPVQIQHCHALAYQYLLDADRLWSTATHTWLDHCRYQWCLRSLFLGELHYLELLYHASVFLPVDTGQVRPFWFREAGRLKRFLAEHPTVRIWYRDCQSKQRLSSAIALGEGMGSCDQDRGHLVGQLLGHQCYHRLVMVHLMTLKRLGS